MIIEALERDLPPATLLLGPDLEQMVQAARWSVNGSGLIQADRLIARHVSAVDARGIVRFAQTAPFGPFKLVIAALDGATPQAQNILLKVLEEPPETIRFILVATARPLPTIVSRCQVITVSAVDGRPESDGPVAAQVSAALKSAMAGDLAALDAALRVWGDAQHAVLSSWLAGAAAGQLRRRDVKIGVTRLQARRLLGVLGRFSGAHPRLAAHAALVTVLSDREQHD